LMLAKPEPLKRVRDRRRRLAVKLRRLCRLEVLQRAGWRCERCGSYITDNAPEWHPLRAHVNERDLRSGGADPTNPDHCEALCQRCHMPNGRS
jgi:5-methylcytosine-specific restriction endonuclease McrA